MFSASSAARSSTLPSPPPPRSTLEWIDRAGKRQGAVGEPACGTTRRSLPMESAWPSASATAARSRATCGSRPRQGNAHAIDLRAGIGLEPRLVSGFRTRRVHPRGRRGRQTPGSMRRPPRAPERKSSSPRRSLRRCRRPVDLGLVARWERAADHALQVAGGELRDLDPAALGGRQAPAADRYAADEYSGVLSPDGRWIAYSSRDSGRGEIYVQAFPGPGGSFRSPPRAATPRLAKRRQGAALRGADGRILAAAIQTVAVLRGWHGRASVPGVLKARAASPCRRMVSVSSSAFLALQPAANTVRLILNWQAELKP